MTGWITLFDISAEPFRWGNAGEGLVALAIVALGIAAAVAVRARTRAGAAVCMLVALGGAGAYVERTLRHRYDHERCQHAVVHAEGRVVEGIVHDYRPAGAEHHRTRASFRVDGERIEYPLIAEGCGLYQSALEDDSRLRDGARVRLRLWEGQILRLEVAR